MSEPMIWKHGDPPERLWELLSHAQERGTTIRIRPGGTMRASKNPTMGTAGAFVLDGDLAFWPEEVSVETRTLVDIIAPLIRAQGDVDELLAETIAELMGLKR